MVTAPTSPWTSLNPSARAAFAVDGVEPASIARPATPEEAATILREAAGAGLAVTPRGGGTHLGIGNRPTRSDLVLDTTRLNRVVEYEPADLTVTVQAGKRFDELQTLLNAQGQMLALDPALSLESTIGGVVAANLSGPLRFAYGTTRDLVIGARVANVDGTVTKSGGRVVKNVAGYDITKLHVGALGTLGVLVELSFKLWPLPPVQETVAAHFPTLTQAQQFVSAAVRAGLYPQAIELLSSEAAREVGLDAAPAVVADVAGHSPLVERHVRELDALTAKHAGQRIGTTRDTWERTRTLSRRPGAAMLKATTPISATAALVETLSVELAAFTPVVWAHAANGVVYANLSTADDTLAPILKRLRAARSDGTITVLAAPTDLKPSLDVWGPLGDAARLMQLLKSRFDPTNTLNPGRYV